MTLRQLTYLLAVAEEHSFTRAAQRVGIEQSPLSRAILQLERNIGFLLLERTRPSCKLTPAGEIFVQHALAIIDLAEHAVRKARTVADSGADSKSTIS